MVSTRQMSITTVGPEAGNATPFKLHFIYISIPQCIVVHNQFDLIWFVYYSPRSNDALFFTLVIIIVQCNAMQFNAIQIYLSVLDCIELSSLYNIL